MVIWNHIQLFLNSKTEERAQKNEMKVAELSVKLKEAMEKIREYEKLGAEAVALASQNTLSQANLTSSHIEEPAQSGHLNEPSELANPNTPGKTSSRKTDSRSKPRKK